MMIYDDIYDDDNDDDVNNDDDDNDDNNDDSDKGRYTDVHVMALMMIITNHTFDSSCRSFSFAISVEFNVCML